MSVVFAVLFIAILYLMRTFVFSKEISGNIRYDSVLYVSSIIKIERTRKKR